MKFALLMAVSVCVFHFTLAAKKLRVAQAQTVLQLQSEGLVAQEPQKPKAWCKLKTSKAYEDKGYKDDVDIDLYYKSLEALIAKHKELQSKKVKVTDIIPNSGSGTYWYGCPHANHPEVGALSVNDLDGMCISKECDEAFQAEVKNDAKFYTWGQDRASGGLVFEAEVFNAKEEAKGGNFGKDKRHYWKSGMLELYGDGPNKVKPVRIKSKKGNEIAVPNCEAMCFFKRVMLNGTPAQRKNEEGGPAKLKQDLLDLKCLMKNCELDHECKPKANAEMPAGLKGVAYGPADGGKCESSDPPYAKELEDFMKEDEYKNYPPKDFPCKKLNGMGNVKGTLQSMWNIDPIDLDGGKISDKPVPKRGLGFF